MLFARKHAHPGLYTSSLAAQVQMYRRGERLHLSPDALLEIETGVVAQSMLHADGTEVLLGLFGPSQLLIPHPKDNCSLQLVAHTDATVHVQLWQQALQRPELPERLRARLWQQEAWAAMQARPYLEDRLLGILTLLAEQFGTAHPEGLLIDIRLTHAQLASAIGATRTTITRLLGELRKRNRLSIIGAGNDERICLCQLPPDYLNHHVRFATAKLSD